MLDDALVQFKKLKDYENFSLNPCCAGRCSSTDCGIDDNWLDVMVSILVVLDDALVPLQIKNNLNSSGVSILVVLDDALVLEKQRLY